MNNNIYSTVQTFRVSKIFLNILIASFCKDMSNLKLIKKRQKKCTTVYSTGASTLDGGRV